MPRKEKQYHYLYKTTNMINNKFYVGMHSTDDLEDGYLGSGKRLRYSIRKHGKENFVKEILSFFKDRKDLIDAEIEMVNDELIKNEQCMNLMNGGKGGFISDEQQQHRSLCGGRAFAVKLETDEEFSQKFKKHKSDLLKNTNKCGKIKYNTFEGKNHTDETKQKIGAANSIKQYGENNSQYGTCWITKKEENKKIKKEELDLYISLGWSKGRITKLKQ